jgi:hypothetical protein
VSGALDAHLAEHAHRELHERTVAAPPEKVWRAMNEVTATELAVTRPLMALRGLPARLHGSGDTLAAAPATPFVERFMRRGWGVLGARAPELFAAGAIGQPWRLRGGLSVPVTSPAQFAAFGQAGYVRMAMSFELAPAGAGTRLRTETRVQPTDAASARAFARYWVAIRLPSGLIRRDLLRAIARRAERRA